MKTTDLSRRAFLEVTGVAAVGINFPFILSGCDGSDTNSNAAGRIIGTGTDFLCWVAIMPDNSAVVRIPQTDLGQGVTTTIAQVIADEMELDWSRLTTEFYDPRDNAKHDNVFAWTTTLGSSSAHYLFDPARVVAATIKSKLIAAAARRLSIPVNELNAADSFVIYSPTDIRISYAHLAQEAVDLMLPEGYEPSLKPASQRQLIGKPVAQFNLADTTHGAKSYGIDFEIENMRHAIVEQCPVYGGKLLGIDKTRLVGLDGNPDVFRIDGFLIGYNSPVPDGQDPDLWAAEVRTDDAVAIVADTWWQAKTALEALSIKWSKSAHSGFSSESLEKTLRQKVEGNLPLSGQHGDFHAAIAKATTRLNSVYSYPFVDSAPLEPMNCTALVDDGEAHVWTNSQYPDDAWRITFELAGIEPNNAHVHIMPAGGGFGRRLHNDFVYQAVRIACQNRGIPIKLVTTREESTKHSYYSPLTVARFEAGMSAENQVIAWSCRVASGYSADQAYGATRIPFTIPNTRFEYERDKNTPVPFGWVRGVGFSQHLWMNYSFFDELREQTGRNPIEFYRAHLDPERVPEDIDNYDLAVRRAERNLRMLEFCVEHGAWNTTKGPGVGRGICVSDSDYFAGFGSSTKAAIVDVTLDAEEFPKIKRIFLAIDAGTIINPDVVSAQLEGGVAFALTTALYSEITIENGGVQQSNFHDYPILKMDQMPPLEIVIVPSFDSPKSVGEDAVPITIAALVNAIADAGGQRIRRLPISSALKA